jgi:aspartate/methionine/tyrosine aminotransferase
MQIPARVRNVAPALMAELGARVLALRAEGADVINLGQGVPGFPPVTAAIEETRQALEEPSVHVYSGDAGTLSLRRALR